MFCQREAAETIIWLTEASAADRQGIDIPMARINSVQFRHGVIDRMFKTGTLIIESASDDPLEFDDIPNVEAVHKMLYDELYDELHDDGKG